MELRNGTLVGRSQLPEAARPAFEEGVGLIFSQWTALCLAVENEWGGPMSTNKADQFIDDIIQWFYRKREHHVDDLEGELHQGMVEEFSTEAEDGSTMQIANQLIALHEACCRGDGSVLLHLQQQQQHAAGARGCVQQQMADDASSSSSSGDEGGGGGGDGADAMDEDMVEAPAAVPMAAAQQQQQQQRAEPVVDADGFELVQGRRRGRR